MTSSLFEIIQLGGPIMWAIFACSVVAIGVVAERLMYYHRCSVKVGEFLTGIRSLLLKKSYNEALERCDEVYGPAVRVIKVALLKRQLPKSELREIVREVAQMEVPRLEANLSLLGTIGYIAPLLGLLGTVTGMIKAFMEISKSSGSAPIGELAGGIWEALITTAGGLVVAIPAYVAYNFLASRMNTIINDMERAGIEVVQLIYDPGSPPAENAVDIPVPHEAKPSEAADKPADKSSGKGSAEAKPAAPDSGKSA